MNKLTKTHLSDSVGMSLITISLSEGHPAEMYLNPSIVIYEEREEVGGKYVYMLESESFSWMQFSRKLHPGPHKVKPYIWNQTNPHSQRRASFMLRYMCVMLWSVHMVSGRTRVSFINPTLHLATAAFFTLPVLQIQQSTVCSQKQEDTRENREE